MNKWQQKWAMDEFVAGRLGPGEMGNGVLLEEVAWEEKMRMNAQYYDHAFQQYVSDIISVNRSLPDRSVEVCFVLKLKTNRIISTYLHLYIIQTRKTHLLIPSSWTHLCLKLLVWFRLNINCQTIIINQNISHHQCLKNTLH